MSNNTPPSNVVRFDFARAKAGKGPEPTELRYAVGEVRSGHVQFVAVVPGTRQHVKFTVSPGEARQLGYDLLGAAGKAEEWTKHLRGFHRYIVEPGDAPGVIFVRHADEIHRWREVAIKKSRYCASCRIRQDPGQIMYQQAEGFGRWVSESAARRYRLCASCARPAPGPDIKPTEAPCAASPA
jgi:hypothetical protein